MWDSIKRWMKVKTTMSAMFREKMSKVDEHMMNVQNKELIILCEMDSKQRAI